MEILEGDLEMYNKNKSFVHDDGVINHMVQMRMKVWINFTLEWRKRVEEHQIQKMNNSLIKKVVDWNSLPIYNKIDLD